MCPERCQKRDSYVSDSRAHPPVTRSLGKETGVRDSHTNSHLGMMATKGMQTVGSALGRVEMKRSILTSWDEHEDDDDVQRVQKVLGKGMAASSSKG